MIYHEMPKRGKMIMLDGPGELPIPPSYHPSPIKKQRISLTEHKLIVPTEYDPNKSAWGNRNTTVVLSNGKIQYNNAAHAALQLGVTPYTIHHAIKNNILIHGKHHLTYK